MPPSANIEKLIARKGLSAAGEVLLVGVVSGDRDISWGNCGPVPDIPAAIAILEERIAPQLENHPLHNFPDLVSRMDTLRETIKEKRPIVQETDPEEGNGQRTLSRRQLISGLMIEEEPQKETVLVHRPLPAALRFGTSEAILQGIARSAQKSPRQVLRESFHVADAAQAVSLLVDAENTGSAIIGPLLASGVGAVLYNTGRLNQQQSLGHDAKNLQAHIRQVKSWLMETVAETRPVVQVNLQGGFTPLYENDEGKILGALYGLEQAAKPYELVIENAVRGNAADASKVLKKVRSYLSFRKMTVKLGAGFTLFPPAALKTLAAEGAVHQIRLHLRQFGSIAETMVFISEAKSQGLEVIVHDDGQNVETAAAVALAGAAHGLSGAVDELYNAIVKHMAGRM